ncbi:S4 domain-containing protein YaaA [Vagococcus coleopterorum]|uniref:S4 domain-containing protein YaaA n=1 Tax=Vagococcus coleopterorum TaxID=2714946 RepID=A0A6G8AM39_9ENTE|nr:S4 domain-containing protein YaaA [Vagococcus coleopterorum]QIL45993.1 S4 domain-containing protein YaaA [Vagococcus coleopterorum]
MKEKFILKTEFITLGQFLKEITIISSGGQAKWYLRENVVFVDGEEETRRGRKLYAGMMIEIPGEGTYFMEESNGNLTDEVVTDEIN